MKNYDAMALESKRLGTKAAAVNGFFMSTFMVTMSLFQVYAWWIATAFVANGWQNARTGEDMTIIDIVVSYQALSFGMFTFTAIIGLIPPIMRARVIGKIVFDLIDRVPEIKSPDDCVEDIRIGDGIHFDHVKFRYPTAPEGSRDVLTDANFTIKAGTSTAIVGGSGSGKSTIV